jgi:hypothetical protein
MSISGGRSLVGNGLWVCPFTRLALSLARQKVIKADGIRGHNETFNIPQAFVVFPVNDFVRVPRAACLIVVA